MRLVIIPPAHLDRVWREGANQLAEACKWADREVTPDQLKMMLARGERQLLALDAANDAGTPTEKQAPPRFVAFAAVLVQQLPNIRCLYVYSIFAPGETAPECFEHLAGFARHEGCSSIRGACSDAVERLWARKFKARTLYHICEIDV
jgi:hypothetical protein